MSNFRDQLTQDNKVFLNMDEFATKNYLDGVEYPMIVDESYNKHPLSYAEGVFLYYTTIYIEPAVLGYMPEEGQRVQFNDNYMRVAKVSSEDGLLVIDLEGNET